MKLLLVSDQIFGKPRNNAISLTLLMMMPLISSTDMSVFLHSFPSQIIALTRSEAGLEF